MAEAQYHKASEIDADVIGDELILMHLVTRRVVILNAACLVLWDALDLFHSRAELLAIAGEALPDRPAGELEAGLDAMLDSLTENGFLRPEPATGGLPAVA